MEALQNSAPCYERESKGHKDVLRDLEHFSCGKELGGLGLFSLGRRKLRGVLLMYVNR